MNKLTIIGNLTHSPSMRQVNTATGAVSVCDFTVAVNGRKKDDEAQFFRCTAWRGLADMIGKYAEKGRKVCVIGPVSVRQYTGKDGTQKASLDVSVDDFEFCERKPERGEAYDDDLKDEPPKTDGGMTVVEDADLPF